MNELFLAPASLKKSVVSLPGSKSITNRALLLASLSKEPCQLHNVLEADDSYYLCEALKRLGITINRQHGNIWQVYGQGGFFLPQADLFLGNAGTAFRSLTAVLALQQSCYHLRGTPRMHERPIGDLVDALRQIGVHIKYENNIGYPPLHINPFVDNYRTKLYVSGKVSSQFLSALLIALPQLRRPLTIYLKDELISQPYVDITLKLLAQFGIKINKDEQQSFFIPAKQSYCAPKHYWIEGDASSASYFWAASYLSGVPIQVEGVGKNSIQGDVAFLQHLDSLGATITYDEHATSVFRNPAQKIPAFDIDAKDIPDAAMVFCIIALAAQGTSHIRGVESWRVKETDRLNAMACELQKLGAQVSTNNDSISITPPEQLTANAHIKTYDDHRMAMCLSLVSLLHVPIVIHEPNCVNKTFPDFFHRFADITCPLDTTQTHLETL